MSAKRRFLSTWSGIATLIFITGIFIPIRPLGYSSFSVALVMWITGGIIANLLFGSEKRRIREGRTTRHPFRPTADKTRTEFSMNSNLSCQSCGSKIESDTRFCHECGSSIELAAR